MATYARLLGTPYSERDCYGIVADFYKLHFGIELKSYYDEIPQNRDIAQKLIYSSLGDFSRVEAEKVEFGDLILIRLYGVDSHIGVYLGNGQMLHSTLHSGCVIDRIVRWKHLISGFYRVTKNDTTSEKSVIGNEL